MHLARRDLIVRQANPSRMKLTDKTLTEEKNPFEDDGDGILDS